MRDVVLAIAFGAVGTMLNDHVVTHPIDAGQSTAVREPALSHFLFHDTRSAPLWLAIRLYVGIAWLTAGWEKITGSPSWLSNGGALKGYWTNAAAIPKTGNVADPREKAQPQAQYGVDSRLTDPRSLLVAPLGITTEADDCIPRHRRGDFHLPADGRLPSSLASIGGTQSQHSIPVRASG